MPFPTFMCNLRHDQVKSQEKGVIGISSGETGSAKLAEYRQQRWIMFH